MARLATGRPVQRVDSTVTVMTFAEEGGAPRIPGTLVRAAEGSEIRVRVRNALPESTLVVHGLRVGTRNDDTLHVAPGATREVVAKDGADIPSSLHHEAEWRDPTGAGARVRSDVAYFSISSAFVMDDLWFLSGP